MIPGLSGDKIHLKLLERAAALGQETGAGIREREQQDRPKNEDRLRGVR